MTIDVACAADSRYLPHGAAMLHSVLSAPGGSDVTVHFLHGPELPDESLHLLAGMVRGLGGSIELHRIEDARIAGLPDWGRIPATMWYRIFLPELLGAVDRVLYLDIDTIVVASLSPLWELELDDYYVAAVTNVPERHRFGHAAALGMAGPSDYFNSGVLLLNLDRMRRDGCSDELRRLVADRRDHLLWPDQDALNLVLGPRRLGLDPRWNLMNSVLRFDWSAGFFGAQAVADAIANPAIVHFEGPRENKPWHILCDHPMREQYFAHRRQTPWPKCPREGVTIANLARLAARRVR